MFFDKNKINSALLCKHCEIKLDIPKCLPCGQVICSLCASSIILNIDNKFDCLICKTKHEMPKEGLISIKPFLEMLSVEPIKVSRGKSFDNLEKSLDDIQKKRGFIKHGIENSTDLVNEYCMNLRSDVQLTTEEAIQQINDLSEKIIEEIDEYEQELIQFNKANCEYLKCFDSTVKELESFHAVNTKYLSQYEVDDEMLIKSNEEAINLINKAELEIKNLKEIIFDERLFKFEKNNNKIVKSILGESKVIDNRLNLNILSGRQRTRELMSLCEFPLNQKLNLIYRASYDGFEAANFHTKCDGMPNTLVIIKSENGNVFGGYTEQSWSNMEIKDGWKFKTDPNSFIFSFLNKLDRPLKIKDSQNGSIGCHFGQGPTFGGGNGSPSDIYICDKSNVSKYSDSNIGNSFTHANFQCGSDEAKSFIAGSFNFQVLEIEVYTK